MRDVRDFSDPGDRWFSVTLDDLIVHRVLWNDRVYVSECNFTTAVISQDRLLCQGKDTLVIGRKLLLCDTCFPL